jgi:PHP domain-containing protein
MFIDLHTHSQYSVDALNEPESLLHKAKELGLKAIAITDHNSIESTEKALVEAKKINIRLIPGVELDLRWGPENRVNHFLCFWADHTNHNFLELIKTCNQYYDKQYLINSASIIEDGYSINEPLFKKWLQKHYSLNPQMSMWRLLDYFIDKKIHITKEESIKIVTKHWKTEFPNNKFPNINDVLPIIRKAKGILLLAHPGPVSGDSGSEKTLRYLLDKDKIDGFEVFHLGNQGMYKELLKIAKEYNCGISGGSDCHNMKNYKNDKRKLGVSPPVAYQVIQTLENAYQKRYQEMPLY